jgi:hypothetical protein
MIEDNDEGIVVISKFMEVIETVFKMEYNTAGMQKKLTVEESNINMFEDIHMMNGDIVEFIVMVKEVFYNKFEGIHMRKVVIFKFEEVVRTIIDKKEYNTMEMREELVIEENIIMLEDTNMRDRVIFKFVKTVIKMVYRTAEMKKRITVKDVRSTGKREDFWSFRDKEKSTKKHEDFWSFRDIETRLCLILEGEGVS